MTLFSTENKSDHCISCGAHVGEGLGRVSIISGPGIDMKETVGQYEFSIVPRSLFAADGTMLHCASKSKLMSILEKLDDNRNNLQERSWSKRRSNESSYCRWNGRSPVT